VAAGTPEQHLAGFAGLMQADAYAGFNRLYAAERKPAPIVEAACWAHARRKFFDLARINKAPIAAEAVSRIDALFAIERQINGAAAPQRVVVDDGRLCMTNNAAERELRAVAVGRRNWTFAGSDEGGRRAAAFYTLIATAKLNDVDPQAWLADVLAKVLDYPAKRVGDLLPWNWHAERRAAA